MQNGKELFNEPTVPSDILFELLSSYERYKLLITALDLGVFSLLTRAMLSDELSQTLHTKPELTEKFLNCLVAIGVLEKKKERYINAPLAETYLVPTSPYSVINLIGLIRKGESLWESIVERLRGDVCEVPARPRVFDKNFVVAMAEGAMRGGLQRTLEVLSSLEEFKRSRRLLDLGGGHGLYAIAFVLNNPSLRAVVLDFPDVIDVAREYARSYGVTERIEFTACDFTKEEIGSSYDIVFASDCLYLPREELTGVLKKVKRALLEGGLFITKHWTMNPMRTQPPTTVLWEFRLALGYGYHYVYDNKEYCAILEELGFSSIEILDISSETKPSSIVIARKA